MRFLLFQKGYLSIFIQDQFLGGDCFVRWLILYLFQACVQLDFSLSSVQLSIKGILIEFGYSHSVH